MAEQRPRLPRSPPVKPRSSLLADPHAAGEGYVDVDHSNGTIYGIYGGLLGGLHVVKSVNGGVSFTDHVVDNGGTYSRFFDIVKVTRDGIVYACWSDNQDIYLSHSSDGGVTWAQKVRVNDRSAYRTNIFPWLEVGDGGRVVVVWYGTTTPTNTDASDWNVLFAQSVDASSNTPTFSQQVVSDHVIHGAGISQAGTTGTSANRNLIDYFQVAVDPQGAAVIAFTDDHNDFSGHTYVTRQLGGTSVYADANGTGTVNDVVLPPLPPMDPQAPEVTDFLHDSHAGLLQPIPEDNPYDILWVDYRCANVNDEEMLEVRMKLSDLSAIPPGTNWRVNFTANAPGGLSDRGDQFWLRANTDNLTSYTWGTAVRNSDASIGYTMRGAADFGEMDSANDLVTMRIRLAKLDSVLISRGRPTLTPFSVLHGLRASVFTDGANAIRDLTRGGTSYTVIPCALAGVEPPLRASTEFIGAAIPNPTSGKVGVRLRLARTEFAELAVFDVRGRRVRTIHAGVLAAGEHDRIWDGRTDALRAAAPGVYFIVLQTSDGARSQRIAMTR